VQLDRANCVARAAIGDFDTSRVVARRIEARTVVGSVVYMAPEILREDSAATTTAAAKRAGYSFPADVYAFGMIIYELMTLRQPFDHVAHNFHIVPAILNERIQPEISAETMARYKSTLIPIYSQCIAYRPESRPTISQIRIELQDLCNESK
jgi:serine/threonine protein kinase